MEKITIENFLWINKWLESYHIPIEPAAFQLVVVNLKKRFPDREEYTELEINSEISRIVTSYEYLKVLRKREDLTSTEMIQLHYALAQRKLPLDTEVFHYLNKRRKGKEESFTEEEIRHAVQCVYQDIPI